MMNVKDFVLSPEFVIGCSVLQLTFYVICISYTRQNGFVVLNHQVYYVGCVILFLALVLICNEDVSGQNHIGVNDYLSFFTRFVVCGTSFFYMLIVSVFATKEGLKHHFEYVIFILVGVLSSLILCSCNDLLTTYLAMELQGIAFYMLAAFKKNSNYSVESGLKYFIVGSFASSLFLLGSSFIYGYTGSLNFDDLKLFTTFAQNDFIVQRSLAIDNFELSEDYKILEELRDLLFSLHPYSNSGDILVEDLSDSDRILVTVMNNVLILFYCFSTDSYFWWQSGMEYPDSFLLENNVPLDEIASSVPYFFFSFHAFHRELIPLLQDYAVAPDFLIDDFKLYISDVCSEVGSVNAFTVLDAYVQFIDHHFVCDFEKSPATVILFYAILIHVCKIFHTENVMYIDFDIPIKISTFDFQIVYIGFMLVCLSLFVKLAVAPFHFWSLDVYEGSPNGSTFFFAVVPKIGLFVVLTRLCYSSFYELIYDWQVFFLIFAVLSVLVGSFGALEERKLKTLFAYSSINHTGYLLLSFSTNVSEGVTGMIYYIVIFMLSGLCFWSIYMFLQPKTKTIYYNKHNKELGDLALLFKSNPILAISLTITLFSIAGIPPLVGFLAKFNIFLSVLNISAYLLAFISILLSVISTFYYIRIIKIIYFENILTGKLYYSISTFKAFIISALVFFLILSSVFPTVLYLSAYKAMLLF